eukprot:1810372-Ditylum_brightwellii.AAC.1
MSTITLQTTEGPINLKLRPDAAPITVQYIIKLVQHGLYNNSNFYRSDFVIQCGTHGLRNKTNPLGDIPANETHTNVKVSNTRGTASIAHFDVPDNGNSEFFINLQTNSHLDTVYGGYCVFAQVEENDVNSWHTVDAIAKKIKANPGMHVGITKATLS